MFRAAIITLSDKGARGEREDVSGQVLQDMLQEAGFDVVRRLLLPDEPQDLIQALTNLCDQGEADLILTTGGTGFAPRDQTPEATLAVIERQVPGIPEAMRYYSLQITPRGCLSRGVAGIRKNTLIVNLPGSPKACRENLQPVLPAIEHGLKMLLGTMNECAVNAKD